ncbi:disulfide bond formation protein DsbA [Streptomyces sp. Ru73]|uniref:DsbA family protein n=1 Tax=Streptomyces sp. Ru73 TaxID=2080748 RepID=UPI000CDCFCE7|nr:DsbA family protein [Streptomyces sp. Ru73]POX40401.1 disulfide bond formation protein DsbA [Streptomyces sp. Ru73]
MSAAHTPGRRLAAVGAILALIVGLVAIGVAVGTAVEGDGGSTSAEPEPAASVTDGDSQGRRQMYDDIAEKTARREKGDALAVGRTDAPVVLVEYADYQCGFCGRFARETQPELIEKYVDKGILRIEFRNFTIYGEDSERAARASWAAGRQGKFWELHDALYAKSRKGKALAEDKLTELARSSGVADIDRFRRDMKSDAAAEALGRDQAEGYDLGVQSTPSFLVNGEPIAGAQPTATFTRAIDDAAARAEKEKGGGK